MVKSGMVKSNQLRFFVGYSSWYPDQLKSEIERNSWLISELSSKDIMENNERDMWKRSVKKLGEKKYHNLLHLQLRQRHFYYRLSPYLLTQQSYYLRSLLYSIL